jgi:hypothetical protein
MMCTDTSRINHHSARAFRTSMYAKRSTVGGECAFQRIPASQELLSKYVDIREGPQSPSLACPRMRSTDSHHMGKVLAYPAS